MSSRRWTRIGAIIAAVVLPLGVGVFGVAPARADQALTYQAVSSGRYPIDLALSADGQNLFVISRGDGGAADLRVYDTASMAELAVVPFGDATAFNPTAVTVSGDGAQLWVSFYSPGEVWVYPTAALVAGTPTAPTVLSGGGGFVGLAADPTGRFVYAATLFNPQYQFDTANLAAPPRTVNLPSSGSRGVAARTDGSQVYFTANAPAPNGGILTVDVAADGAITPDAAVITTGDLPWGVSYSAVQNRVVSSNSGSPTSISGLTPGDPASVVTAPVPCGPRLVDTTPSGNRIYVACLTGGIVTYDYVTGALAQLQVGDNVESVKSFGQAGGDADRVYVASGGSDEVLVFTKPTVDPLPSQTVAVGTAATLTATVNDFWQTLQWQQSTDGGATWSDVAGATGESLTVGSASVVSGTQYRIVVVSDLFDDVIGAPATLTVAVSPTPPPAANTLAATGAPVAPVMAAGWLLLAAGVLALFGARRRIRDSA